MRRLKSRLVPAGARPRRVLFGPSRGLRLELDLRHRTQVFLGLNELEVARWLASRCTDIRSAIDAGAAEGGYTLYFLARTPARRVFAFEPAEPERRLLARNLELNELAGDPRLTVSPRFVGAGGETVAVDSLLPGLEFPCLVKIDVEGAEADVLSGAPLLLKRRDVRWLIEIHSSDLEMRCAAMLKQAGLEPRVIKPAWWRALVPEQRPVGVNHWLVAS